MIDVQFLSFRPMLGYGTTEIRCRQPVAFLKTAGLEARADQLLAAPTPRCRLLVLHRVQYDALTRRIVSLARRRGARIVYDTDDFITDSPGADRFSPAIEKAMRLADVASVSGSFLQKKAAAFHPDCRILRNRLSQALLDQGAAAIERKRLSKDSVTIGYFSGSAHHDRDFAMIAPELLRLLEAYPEVRLTVGGKIEVDPAFHALGDRFTFEPFRPYTEFMGLLGGIDINLAPLDLCSDFAMARSELKYLEAAAFGVPSVASPSPAYSEAIAHGRTGFLCSPGEWFDTLSRLVSDPALRRSAGTAARAHVASTYGPEAGASDWGALFSSLVDERAPDDSGALSTLPRALAVLGQARIRSGRRALLALLR